MSTLSYLAAVLFTSVGLVFWQQSAIDRVHADSGWIKVRLASARAGLESDQALLADAQHKLDQIHHRRREIVTVGVEQMKSHTPAREGWWPKERPYFYLAKTYLPQVRFRTLRLPPAEAYARLTNGMASSVTFFAPDTNADEALIHNYLFENGKLNRTMAVLLGMTATEAEQVDDIYARFFRSVQETESRRIERIDPPEPLQRSGTPQTIIARLPDLSAEVKPMIAAANDELSQILGEHRAALLADQVKDYIADNHDKGGLVPREFIRLGNTSIFIECVDQWAKHYSSEIGLPVTQHSKYAHLFGPGAPCELK